MKRLHTFNEFINENDGFAESGHDFTGFTAKQITFLKSKAIRGFWKVNSNGKIDVAGHVVINKKMKTIPVQFGTVSGSFSTTDCNELISLKGSPEFVGGNFSCFRNIALTSLEGAPRVVKGEFNCSYCQELKDLKGSPEEVGKSFACNGCPNLESLEGATQKVGKTFNAEYCYKLRSLKGGPKDIEVDYIIGNCRGLTSLEGSPNRIGGNFFFAECPNLTSLKGITPDVGGEYHCWTLYKYEWVPGELVDIYNKADIFKEWVKKGMPNPKTFLHQKRGTIKGQEFGF
jgi:hypothetical protein